MRSDMFSGGKDPVRDLPTTRPTGLAENDYVLKQTDPYGFWKVSREKGQVPEELSGSWTTPEKAKLAVTTYLLKQKKN
jgi:hypothetical protein